MDLNFSKNREPAPESNKSLSGRILDLLDNAGDSFYSWRVALGLLVAFFLFWNLANWTSWTTQQLNPSEMIFNRENIQLWIAAYRLTFAVGIAVMILRLVYRVVIHYWRRDVDPDEFDATKDFVSIPPLQRLWFSFAVLFSLCWLFVQLLQVKLPEAPSALP